MITAYSVSGNVVRVHTLICVILYGLFPVINALYVILGICLSVCLFVCLQLYLNSADRIFMDKEDTVKCWIMTIQKL